jgi:hypothetical protein
VRIAYIGNFEPAHSTENDIRQTLQKMGVEVVAIQEQSLPGWQSLFGHFGDYDAILWTSTKHLAERISPTVQLEMLYWARKAGTPTIGFHLDRWWGLSRWRSVLERPFFRCQYVFTADGAHDDEFHTAGVNHEWSPPAIAPHNVMRGTPRPEFTSDIAFVGSWEGSYHAEWRHRQELVDFLRRTYGSRVAFWPKQNKHAIRGDALADLYASVKVVVGDSCLVPTTDGKPMHHYCSDRVFETIGRGGMLVHPYVDGVTDRTLVESGIHLLTWELFDWDQLADAIDQGLDEGAGIAGFGYEHVANFHTYWNRLDAIFATVGLDDYAKPAMVLP